MSERRVQWVKRLQRGTLGRRSLRSRGKKVACQSGDSPVSPSCDSVLQGSEKENDEPALVAYSSSPKLSRGASTASLYANPCVIEADMHVSPPLPVGSPWGKSFRDKHPKSTISTRIGSAVMTRLAFSVDDSGLSSNFQANTGQVDTEDANDHSATLRLLYFSSDCEDSMMCPSSQPAESPARSLCRDQSICSENGHFECSAATSLSSSFANGSESSPSLSVRSFELPVTAQEVAVAKTIESQLPDSTVLLWESGVVYVGHVDKETMQPQGQGIMMWSSRWGKKHVYCGEFALGRLCGKGTMVWSTGKEATGQWRNDALCGQCTVKWPNGCQYDGEMEDNVFSGCGAFSWPGGIRLQCETWSNGHASGPVCVRYQDGSQYQGDLLHGEQHGSWEHSCSGVVVHRALWHAGEPVDCAEIMPILPSWIEGAGVTEV